MCAVHLNIFFLFLAVNFTSDWATGYIKTNTTYKSFSNATVSAEIGLHVGFDGINVTLKGKTLIVGLISSLPDSDTDLSAVETIR